MRLIGMHRYWTRLALATSIAMLLILVCWLFLPGLRRNSQARAKNQDAVYEAVVREVFASGQPKPTQLVFDENLQSGDAPWSGSSTACMESVRQDVSQHRYTPMFNTLADKVYRSFAHGAGDYSIRADTVEDFVKESCIGGHLSQTFRTDLPRVYISPASVSFKQVYPGPTGSFRSLVLDLIRT